MVSLDLEGDDILIRFPYDETLISRVKTLTRRFDKHALAWRINASRIHEVRKLFPGAREENGFIQHDPFRVQGLNFPDRSINTSALRQHQREALAKLSWLLNCGNFDDCGAGKTRVGIAWATRYQKVLVICRSVAKIFWSREIEVCLPGAVTDILAERSVGVMDSLLHGTGGIRQDAQWVICPYGVLDARLSELMDFGFEALLLDEAHLTKNAGTAVRKPEDSRDRGTRRGNSTMKLAEYIPNRHFITASPDPNGRPLEMLPMLLMLHKVHPDEVFKWKLNFCDGKRVCINEMGVKYHKRTPRYRWSFSGASNLDDLAAQLSTFSVRRQKSEIMPYLPAVTHQILEIELSNAGPYLAMRDRMKRLAKSGDPKLRGEALGLLTKMIAWCASAKCASALEKIKEYLDAGHRLLVYSGYLAPLATLRGKLLHQSTILEGGMSDDACQAIRDKFQSDRTPHVLLCSRKYAGESITLTAAKALISLDYPWNPEDYKQMYGRMDREGKTEKQHVINIHALDTYDDEQLEMIYYKAGVIQRTAGRPPLPESRALEFEQMVKLLGGARP